MKLCPVFSVVFAAFIAGCAADTTNEVTDEGTAETASDLTGKTKHHYSPSIQDVTWHPGCGAVRLNDPPCPFGLTMTFTKNYADLTFTHSEHVDNGTHTLTITVDAWSYGTIHSMIAVHPETIALAPKNLQLSTQYKVIVRDRSGKSLYTGSFGTYLAV